MESLHDPASAANAQPHSTIPNGEIRAVALEAAELLGRLQATISVSKPEDTVSLVERLTKALAALDDLDGNNAHGLGGTLDRLRGLVEAPDLLDDKDVVCEKIDLYEQLTSRVRQIEANFLSRLGEWLEEHGELSIGDITWYFGVSKTTKCRDVSRVLELLIDHVDGDVGELACYLSSQPVKHGAVSKTISEEQFDSLFEKVATGSAKKKPIKVNKAFVR